MNFNNILFLDIETVAQYETYNHMPADVRELWDAKAQFLIRNKETETCESVYERAGIYAEFGKIICISCGYLTGSNDNRKLVVKSFSGKDEKALLIAFKNVLESWGKDNTERTNESDRKFLCAHNGREFDYPYLCRRMIVNCVPLPKILTMYGKKPWEICHYDTLELWKFGDYKHYTSLKLLAQILGIPSPKDDIDGSQVNAVFWNNGDIERIVRYCEKDVITLAQLFLRLYCEPAIKDESIEIKDLVQTTPSA
jgi:3'-5' exonuclease